MTLIEKRVTEFLDELASRKPAPGGGSAGALAGSMAAALVEMVARLTGDERAMVITSEVSAIRTRLINLVDEDCEAFMAFMKAPAGEKQAALLHAAFVPLETAELSYRVLILADEMARTGNKNAITDAGVACLLADTAVRGASLNVRINLRYIKGSEVKKELETKLALVSDSAEKSQTAMQYILERLQT